MSEWERGWRKGETERWRDEETEVVRETGGETGHRKGGRLEELTRKRERKEEGKMKGWSGDMGVVMVEVMGGCGWS